MKGWKSASCYTRQDVRNCESQYGYSSSPPPMSSAACRNYQDFRDCVVRIVRQSCYSQDLQLMATYLIDKAADLSWNCVINSDSSGYNPNRMDGTYNDPYRGGGTNYGNNPNYDPNRYDSNNRYDPNRYDANRVGTYDNNRPGVGSYGSQYGSQSGGQYGSQYDRDRYGGTGTYAGSQQYPGSNQPIGNFFATIT